MITNLTTLPDLIVNTNLLPVYNDSAALAVGLTRLNINEVQGGSRWRHT